jgi:hypothetical protein
VEHLYPDCRLAGFGEIPIHHLIRPSFRHASKERFEAGPHPPPKLTKGQRLDASDLLEPPLPRPLTHGHAKGVAIQLRCLLAHHQVSDAQLPPPPMTPKRGPATPHRKRKKKMKEKEKKEANGNKTHRSKKEFRSYQKNFLHTICSPVASGTDISMALGSGGSGPEVLVLGSE